SRIRQIFSTSQCNSADRCPLQRVRPGSAKRCTAESCLDCGRSETQAATVDPCKFHSTPQQVWDAYWMTCRTVVRRVRWKPIDSDAETYTQNPVSRCIRQTGTMCDLLRTSTATGAHSAVARNSPVLYLRTCPLLPTERQT